MSSSDNAAVNLTGSYLFPSGLPKRKTKKREAKSDYVSQAIQVSRLRAVPNVELGADWFWGIGSSMAELRSDLQYSLRSNLNVLIIGETGTGKELLAKKIHQERKRLELLSDDESPFISINCSTVPESLAESILFGHERGAFTSARDKQLGKFELAKQGTLFLDEIQNLSMEVQAKLLRALEEREVERLGGKSTYKIECKIIAASNVPLEILVEQNKFRRDLYYRLNISPLYIPSVRNRLEDFPTLLKGLLQKVSNQLHCEVPEVSPSAYQLLAAHPWPGNLREMENALTFSVLRSEETIEVEHLPRSVTGKLSHYLNTGDWL